MGDFVYSVSVSAGYNSGVSGLGDPAGGSYYGTVGGFAGVSDGHANYGLGYSSNSFSGKTAQRVGAVTLQVGDFSLRVDEDFGIGDGGDRYRTGGALLTYRVNEDLTLAFGGSMMTGMANINERLDYGNTNLDKRGRMLGTYDNCGEDLFNLRGGSMYGGAIYKGQAFFGGHSSEKRLYRIQDKIHNKVGSPHFEHRGFASRMYSYYGTYHHNYLFY